MSGYRLTRKAIDDVEGIGLYTTRRWGGSQTEAYVNSLHDVFGLLCSHSTLGRSREPIVAGLRSLRHGSHIIFYRVHADGISIERILHTAQAAKPADFPLASE